MQAEKTRWERAKQFVKENKAPVAIGAAAAGLAATSAYLWMTLKGYPEYLEPLQKSAESLAYLTQPYRTTMFAEIGAPYHTPEEARYVISFSLENLGKAYDMGLRDVNPQGALDAMDSLRQIGNMSDYSQMEAPLKGVSASVESMRVDAVKSTNDHFLAAVLTSMLTYISASWANSEYKRNKEKKSKKK